MVSLYTGRFTGTFTATSTNAGPTVWLDERAEPVLGTWDRLVVPTIKCPINWKKRLAKHMKDEK